jgi:two-component system cell cycle response regulator CpdR
VISISVFRKCSFYRDSGTLAIGRGLGYCDLDGDQTTCDGDVQFCEKPDALNKHSLEQKRKEVSYDRRGEDQKIKSSNYKVLVVDDEERTRKLIVTLLSQQGHQCMTAGNGIEALNKISQNKFDAVIADIVMPEMDGTTLTKKLSKECPRLPVMVMTGYDEYSAEVAIASGAREFIRKPFSIAEFIIRFHKMMLDHEILCQIEAKKNEAVFNIQRNSNQRIEELKREVEILKSKLTSFFRDPHPF